MSKGKKFLIAVAVLVFTALVSGLTTMAVTNYGTRDDPLVTLSYLNNVLTPQLEAAFNEALEAKAAELAGQGGLSGTTRGTSAAPSEFAVLTLQNGQTVRCGVGAEIMLRIGSAVSAGPDTPRLIDETGGAAVAEAGKTLTVNHMYLVTIINNGVTATRDNTKILIRGAYTVS